MVIVLLDVTQDKEDTRLWRANFVSAQATRLMRMGREKALIFITTYNPDGRTSWLEKPNGEVIVGQPFHPLMTKDGRPNLPGPIYFRSGVTLWETGLELDRSILIMAPVYFEGIKYHFFYVSGTYVRVPKTDIFYQGFIGLLIVGGVLSYWVAKKVARPLATLQQEVIFLANEDLNSRVSIQGDAAVALVAKSINILADRLCRNIAAMKDLVASVSHELRSPLTRATLSVSLMDEFLEEALTESAGQNLSDSQIADLRQGLKDLADEHARMNQLIGDILLSHKLEFIADAFKAEPIPISELIMELATRYQNRGQQREVTFEAEVASELWALGDYQLTYLLASNLLDNALKYSPKNGLIRLALKDQDALIKLTVENLAPPLGSEVLSQAFEPFFRGPNSQEGFGLGLPLAKKIVALFQATIKIENQAEGERNFVRLTVLFPNLPSSDEPSLAAESAT